MYLSFAAQAFQTENNSNKNHKHLCISQYSFLQRKIYILVKGRVSQSAVFLCKLTRKKINSSGTQSKCQWCYDKIHEQMSQGWARQRTEGKHATLSRAMRMKTFPPYRQSTMSSKKKREFCTQSACFSSEKCCIIGDPDFLISIALHNS